MVVALLRKVLPSLSPAVKHRLTVTSKREESPGISLSLSQPAWTLLLLLLGPLMLLSVLRLRPLLLPGKFHEQGDSDSLQLHRLQPTRFLCLWDSPGKNTGVGFHFLLQEIFPTQGLHPYVSCIGRQILYNLSHLRSPRTCKHLHIWSFNATRDIVWECSVALQSITLRILEDGS